MDADTTIEDDRSPSVAREVKQMKEEMDRLQKQLAELTEKRHQQNGEVGLKASTEEHEARFVYNIDWALHVNANC